MFQDVGVKVQVHMYLNFDVNALKRVSPPTDHHICSSISFRNYTTVFYHFVRLMRMENPTS